MSGDRGVAPLRLPRVTAPSQVTLGPADCAAENAPPIHRHAPGSPELGTPRNALALRPSRL